MTAAFQSVYFTVPGIVIIGMIGLESHDDRSTVRRKVTLSAYILWYCRVVVKVDSTFERRARELSRTIDPDEVAQLEFRR